MMIDGIKSLGFEMGVCCCGSMVGDVVSSRVMGQVLSSGRTATILGSVGTVALAVFSGVVTHWESRSVVQVREMGVVDRVLQPLEYVGLVYEFYTGPSLEERRLVFNETSGAYCKREVFNPTWSKQLPEKKIKIDRMIRVRKIFEQALSSLITVCILGRIRWKNVGMLLKQSALPTLAIRVVHHVAMCCLEHRRIRN